MKIAEVIILDDAVEDLELGRRFYEERGEGIGDYFVDSLLSDIESLYLYGGIHTHRFGYQRLLSNRFPFAVYYEIEATSARVIAVLDMRQNPEGIRKSLAKRKGCQQTGRGNE